jgi:hypothetical protein
MKHEINISAARKVIPRSMKKLPGLLRVTITKRCVRLLKDAANKIPAPIAFYEDGKAWYMGADQEGFGHSKSALTGRGNIEIHNTELCSRILATYKIDPTDGGYFILEETTDPNIYKLVNKQ